MNIIFESCVRVARPSISSNPAFGFNILPQKRSQAVFAGIWDERKSEPTSALASFTLPVLIDKNFHSSHRQTPVFRCSNPSTFLAFYWTADKGFIRLDQSR